MQVKNNFDLIRIIASFQVAASYIFSYCNIENTFVDIIEFIPEFQYFFFKWFFNFWFF